MSFLLFIKHQISLLVQCFLLWHYTKVLIVEVVPRAFSVYVRDVVTLVDSAVVHSERKQFEFGVAQQLFIFCILGMPKRVNG